MYQKKRVEYCERDSGSLVLANTSGYHARGPFNTSKEKNKYKWDKNKGYGTKDHLLAIRNYGITNFHRKSFNLRM